MRSDFPSVGLNVSLRQLFDLDYVLLTALLSLAALSFLVLYSASGQDAGVVARQAVRFGIGFLFLFLLAQVPVTAYERWGALPYCLGIVLLLLVLFFGDASKGAQRWLDLWAVKFQPSELLKLGMPMILCGLFTMDRQGPQSWKFIVAFLLLALPVGIVAVQPDLGTAVMIAASGAFVIFLAGVRWGWIVSFFTVTVLLLPVIWHSLHDYQQQRVLAFMYPGNDPTGAGYHILQSKIAIGSGGVWGKGWLQGSQSQLDFIPEQVTDFVFAVFAEEFGLIGSCVLVYLYLTIVFRGVMISVKTNSDFGKLLAAAITLSFFLSFFANIGMVSGLLPVVGVPLPLISYGGTSIVTFLASFGILMSIARHRHKTGFED